MTEAELGHEIGGHEGQHHLQAEHGLTPFAKVVAMGVSLTGVVLAVVGIASHRAHTAAVIDRTDANDQWAYYQSEKTLGYVAEATSNLSALTSDPARSQAVLERYDKDHQHYKDKSESIRHLAESKSQESDHEESRALLLDVSEGFLELGLVLSSLYFMAHRRFFPFLGGISAVVGIGFAVRGLLF